MRSPDLISAQSACRGELLSRAFAQSWARSDCAAKISPRVKMLRFIEIKISILRCRGGCRPTAANQCINAPAAGTAQKDIEKNKTVNHSKLTFVHIRNQTFGGMHEPEVAAIPAFMSSLASTRLNRRKQG